jgi:DNA processing protein
MSDRAPRPALGACAGCARRSWLLGALSPALDFHARDVDRLSELLALEDAELIRAVGGSRRAALEARHQRFHPRVLALEPGVETICRHGDRYPRLLRDAGAPRVLHVAGGARRLAELTAAPVVAILGTRRASDYGVEMAKSLGRGLAASRVTVASALADGIARAAHAGAREVDGATIGVSDDGIGGACPAGKRGLSARVTQRGCAVSELPCDCAGRRWGPASAQRLAVMLADVTVIVEASEGSRELLGATVARAHGRALAAVPGRVISPPSAGSNALLRDGATLVRGARDVLDLLYPFDAVPERVVAPAAPATLEPRLSSTLEAVGAGHDTPQRLADAQGVDLEEVLLRLTELELLGLLARGDGGRYVPRDPLQAASI